LTAAAMLTFLVNLAQTALRSTGRGAALPA
jgi:hypothetical protein